MSDVPKSILEWTPELRKSYLLGVDSLLKFIFNMEMMNEIVRQDIEHIPTENEWESAYSIFFQMQETISLMILWANSDVCLQ